MLRLRKGLPPPRREKLTANGVSKGSQPFILWRNDRLAAEHMHAPADAVDDVVRFCRVFPDAFVVTERAPYYDSG